MKTSEELISALKNGEVLFKIHHSTSYEFLFIECGYLGMRGWSTAHGIAAERIEDIILNPTNWSIVKNFNISQGYPYPWSTKFEGEI